MGYDVEGQLTRKGFQSHHPGTTTHVLLTYLVIIGYIYVFAQGACHYYREFLLDGRTLLHHDRVLVPLTYTANYQ